MDLKEKIGNEAGAVWNAILASDQASFTKIRNETQLKNNEVYEAIGWLAREDKVKREGRRYKLDSTNLTPEIGENAGKIYDALHENNQLTMNDLLKSGRINRKNVWTAIGWLAREDKLEMDEMGRLKLKS